MKEMKFFPKGIYIYKDNDIEKLCVYICDTDNSNEIVVGCIDEPNDLNNDYIKIEGLNKVLYLDRFEILRHSNVIKPLFLKGKHKELDSLSFHSLINNICRLLLVKHERLINKYNCENFDTKNDSMQNIMLPEKMIKLLTWNLKKCELKFNKFKNSLNIIKYGIYFAYLGTNIGCEIEKLRPVVVWKKHTNSENQEDNSYYVFPISSKKQKKDYYYNVKFNLNKKINHIKVNYGKVISIKRILKPYINEDNKRIYMIDKETQKNVKIALKNYFDIKD